MKLSNDEKKGHLMCVLMDHVRPRLSECGFRPLGKLGAFERALGDVRWHIAIWDHPRAEKGTIEAICDLDVLSTPLAKLTHPLPEAMRGVGTGQIKANLQWLADYPATGSRSGAWVCRTEDEAANAGEEIDRLLESVGLPFLQKFPTTNAMIPQLRSGEFCYAVKLRTNYDADVWEGKIDPKTTPWKSPESTMKKFYTSSEEFIRDLKAELAKHREGS